VVHFYVLDLHEPAFESRASIFRLNSNNTYFCF